MALQDTLIKELGLEELPERDRTVVLDKMTETLLKHITVSLLEKLSDDDRKAFLDMQETATPEKIDEFFRGKIQNYEEELKMIINTFKTQMQSLVDDLKKTQV